MTFKLASTALLATVLTVPALSVLSAQDTASKARERPAPRIVIQPGAQSIILARSADRAVLGVTLGASSRGDTAGVRIEGVDSGGPAAKAGLKAGDIITVVNGVSLRVSAADAEDPALVGIAQRRLQRTLAKAKPGDEVELAVRSGGSARTVKVKTVSAADLDGSRVRATTTARRATEDDRTASIGASVGGTGSARDTLGLFIASVVSGGPAEKAGVIEGERIASVNGIDVRVPREDLEDPAATSARVNRFVREIRKVSPGSAVSLRLYSGGKYRDVSVTTVKMSELPTRGWPMPFGDGSVRILRGTAPPAGITFDFEREGFEKAMEALRDRMQELGRDMRFEMREAPRVPPRGTVRATAVVRTVRTSV